MVDFADGFINVFSVSTGVVVGSALFLFTTGPVVVVAVGASAVGAGVGVVTCKTLRLAQRYIDFGNTILIFL